MTSTSSNIILINDKDETPEQCIIREIHEELGVKLRAVSLFVAVQRSYGFENTFWSKANLRVEDILLTEGQAVRWFILDEIRNMKLGYEDNAILEDFFDKKDLYVDTLDRA